MRVATHDPNGTKHNYTSFDSKLPGRFDHSYLEIIRNPLETGRRMLPMKQKTFDWSFVFPLIACESSPSVKTPPLSIMSDKPLNRFRRVAIWEGISFLLLLGIAMPIKYGLGNPWPVKVVGWGHGILFTAYIIFLFQVATEYSWSFRKSFLAFLASLVPFGPFLFDRHLEKELVEVV